ncbi:MAG: Fe-S cluster assembly protein SufD [Verrucomicrobiota bacterium]|jgi:Fe-S cluster assembly protein SufD
MIDTLKERKSPPAAESAGVIPAGPDGQQAQAVLAAFAQAEFDRFPPWLRTIRNAARSRASQLGFPTTRHEEWKFTNIAPVLQLPLHPAGKTRAKITRKDIERFTFGLDAYRLVFVDGHFCPELCSLPGTGSLQLGNLLGQLAFPELEMHLARHAQTDANFFTAFNTAFFQDGAFVSIAADQTAAKLVHLLFIGASEQPGAIALPRNLILAQRGARLKVIESYVSLSDAARVTNAVTELALEEGAEVEHGKVQQESGRAFHIATIQAVQAKDSRWTSHSIATGARLARNQIQTLLNAEGAAAILNGLYLGDAEQLIDHHTVVDHAKAHCESHEFYHGILADRAHGVFNGKIFVRQDAQKTNAKQTNRNLLLSDNATIDTKPQLEIFADDVKCTHGATVGQLSEEAVFYLRSRGIGAEHARRMLIQAFASDVIERIGIGPVRAQLEEMLAERFDRPAE